MLLAEKSPAHLERLRAIARAADEKKAENLVILDVNKLTSLTDYFVFCSGNNPRQNKSIAEEIKHSLGILKERPSHLEGLNNASWILMDYGDIIIHIFMPDVRDFYDLEGLWADAKRLDVKAVINR